MYAFFPFLCVCDNPHKTNTKLFRLKSPNLQLNCDEYCWLVHCKWIKYTPKQKKKHIKNYWNQLKQPTTLKKLRWNTKHTYKHKKKTKFVQHRPNKLKLKYSTKKNRTECEPVTNITNKRRNTVYTNPQIGQVYSINTDAQYPYKPPRYGQYGEGKITKIINYTQLSHEESLPQKQQNIQKAFYNKLNQKKHT